jgi:hypothetical protein
MKLYAFCLAVAMLMPSVFAVQKQTYAIPVQKELAVYQNQIRKLYEKPLFTVTGENRLIVRESGENAVKVEDAEGRTGWVEKKLVTLVREYRKFVYDAASVERYLDAPELIWVEGKDQSVENFLTLSRSFTDELRENVDQETVIRQTY